MAKNNLVPVKFLRRYGVYNAGETAGFEKETADLLCRGDKPFAKSLADIARDLEEEPELGDDPELPEDEDSGWQGNS